MERVVFAGNDYLGLARDPRLAEAACRAAREHGISATSGRFFLGWSALHQQLEADLAAFFGAEAACLLPVAYLGGLVYFHAMAERFRTVFCDEHSHANLFQGMRAAGLEVRTYRHLDAADLERQLAGYRGPRPIVASDGVFGISGEAAPAAELARLSQRFEAELLIDDAHGVFALGRTGRGVGEMFGLRPNESTVLGSMSKALGAGGGFFVGRKALVERLQRGSAGATPSPLPVVAACIEALRIVQAEPERRARAAENARRMRASLASHGVGVVCDQTPIVAMALRDESEAARLAEHFEARGLVVRYARYPCEPRANLLRSAARACHTEEDLRRFDAAAAAFFS
ncbi:MAG TPA: pyridoxal phosphate-dependent aminotransferase family protein [Planctomycetota bacterium]|nr:pyridoxal phosphate-dependent aminotransferase family protein [Planctomycetota bacterium]